MVYITNTLDTQNLKEHCNGIVNKHRISGYTESQGKHCNGIVNKHPGYTESIKEHCNGIVNKHPGYTESQGALQWYS